MEALKLVSKLECANIDFASKNGTSYLIGALPRFFIRQSLSYQSEKLSISFYLQCCLKCVQNCAHRAIHHQ